MTRDEFAKSYANRLLESTDPIHEAGVIAGELTDLVSDEDEEEVTDQDKDIIIDKVKYMVNDEMNRSEDTRELDEDAIIEALDVLEKGEI